MIEKGHKKEAKNIGDNSFELLNFVQLPDTATAEKQIQALRADQDWQEDHNTEISRRIDYLMSEISEAADTDHDGQTTEQNDGHDR